MLGRGLRIGACGLLVCLAGCGQKGVPLAKVTGTVTYDGKPLAGAAVVFSPKSDAIDAGNSWGVTDAAGHYSLKFGRSREGAWIGEHRVAIEHPTRTNYDMSATVQESTNEINFNLEPAKRGEKRGPKDIRDTTADVPITVP